MDLASLRRGRFVSDAGAVHVRGHGIENVLTLHEVSYLARERMCLVGAAVETLDSSVLELALEDAIR